MYLVEFGRKDMGVDCDVTRGGTDEDEEYTEEALNLDVLG